MPKNHNTKPKRLGVFGFGGRNNNHRKKKNADASTGSFTESDGMYNDANPLKEVVLPSVDEPLAMEVQSPLVEQTNAVKSVGESYPPLPTQGTTPNGNTPVVPVESIRAISDRFANSAYGFFLGNSSTGLFSFQFSSMDGLNAMYENGPWFIRSHPIILTKWNPDVNLLKEDAGNVLVWVKIYGVPVTAFNEDELSVIATKLGTPIMLNSYTVDMCLQSLGSSGYARVMIELRAGVELKDTIVVDMPKVECPKNPGLGVGASATKKKPSQAHKGVDSTNMVSDLNPFDVLNSVDNDVEMGTNGGSSNFDKNGANSSGSSFWNVENSSNSTTPTMDKIGKFENLIIDGQAILVDEAGNPLKKVEYPGDHDSEDEVASVDNDMARSLASEKTGFGTRSLLE
ncbi:ribonuclease H-like domain, reverse transcriptase, RNA-dependent DNA polymerase [Tanacetum coccineum]|uniref:Ribonuclease H-like domain, reverse transcriptase, RNA-dependent DNA polymerase n=1 Tax=Tanacetum coccineum TaxID=301880 RepID=A0ABQ5C730_9ASTR